MQPNSSEITPLGAFTCPVVTSASPPVSIVICAYTLDRWEDLCEAVNTARIQEPPVEDLILIIDHNQELEARAREAFPDAAVVANHGKRGTSGARNAGIACARGEILAFLDDDVRADKLWISCLLAEFQDPGVAAVFPLVEPRWEGARPSWFPDEYLWVVGCSYRGLPTRRQEVRNIIGGACLYRRSLFVQVGNFSDRLNRTSGTVPISGEETEICIRASKHLEARFVFQPGMAVSHKVPARRQTWYYFTLRCYAEGLTKAYLTSLVGSERGLSSERSYVLRTLPAGIAWGIGDAIFRRDVSGLGRAAAIVWGLTCACLGYAQGRVCSWLRNGRISGEHGPKRSTGIGKGPSRELSPGLSSTPSEKG